MRCPRRIESPNPDLLWDGDDSKDDGTCKYCGSISTSEFFKAIESGCQITPTDKNYKVYLSLVESNPDELVIRSSANFKIEGYTLVTAENVHEFPSSAKANEYIGNWVIVEPRGRLKTGNFYFQHLESVEDKQKFIDLFNDRKLNTLERFYVLPYFMKVEEV